MGSEEKDDLVKILSDARESNSVLRGMLHGDLTKAKQEFDYVEAVGKNIDSALYKLTGDDFYRKKYGVEAQNG